MPTGLHTVYDLTAGVPINMDTAIYMLDPDDDPMITGVNADGMQILPTAPVDEIQFYWMDETRLVPKSTLAANITTGDAFITLASNTERLRFSTGDLLTIEKANSREYVLVTGYATTAATLDVTRGFNSSTATTHATGATVVTVGTLLAEGSDPEDFRSVDRTERSNYTAIHGPFKIEMSRTEQARRKYGVASEFTHQVHKRLAEINVMRNMALLYGTRYNDSVTKRRSSGGFDYWITTNEETTATQLTVANIQAMQQDCYNAGGVPRILVANPASLGDLNDLDNTSRVRTVPVDGLRGRTPVMVVTTEYGDVTIVRNRWCFPTKAFIYEREQATRRVFDPVLMERLAKTGDADSVQIVAEEGLQFKGQAHAGKWSNLSYTA